MDSTLTLSLLFGMVGTGLLMYGKNAARIMPMGAGLALMVCPYFIPGVAVLLVVCLALTALPFVFRDI